MLSSWPSEGQEEVVGGDLGVGGGLRASTARVTASWVLWVHRFGSSAMVCRLPLAEES